MTARLQLTSPMEILSLPVIEGIVITNLARKEYTVHAPPFSVRAVCTFEEYVCDETKPAQRRVAAGFIRFCTGARARHSDGARVPTEPPIEPACVAESGEGHGYVEAVGNMTKTSQRKGKMRRLIPMPAHSWGLSEPNWAWHWLKARKAEKLDARREDEVFLMPALNRNGKWTRNRKLPPDSITILIREILIESGYPPEEAAKYTSHSMKTTFLSSGALRRA